jgi:hypothetical protein
MRTEFDLIQPSASAVRLPWLSAAVEVPNSLLVSERRHRI